MNWSVPSVKIDHALTQQYWRTHIFSWISGLWAQCKPSVSKTLPNMKKGGASHPFGRGEFHGSILRSQSVELPWPRRLRRARTNWTHFCRSSSGLNIDAIGTTKEWQSSADTRKFQLCSAKDEKDFKPKSTLGSVMAKVLSTDSGIARDHWLRATLSTGPVSWFDVTPGQLPCFSPHFLTKANMGRNIRQRSWFSIPSWTSWFQPGYCDPELHGEAGICWASLFRCQGKDHQWTV